MGSPFSRLYHDLQAVLKNPRADTRLTFLFLGGAVLLVLIVIVALLFFTTEATPPKAEKRRRTRRRPRVIVLAVTLVLLGVVAFADQWATSAPTCGRCHEIRPAVISWQNASHASISCMDCHGQPGIGGWLQTRTRALSNLLTHRLQKGTNPTAANVANTQCLGCHASILRGTSNTGTVRVRHSDFVNDEVACLECHGQVGHGPSSTQRNHRPTMDKCLSCHDGRRASAECTLCHRTDVAVTRQVPDSYPKAQLVRPTSCRGCHDPAPCIACHKVEMPHPPDWAGEAHAKAAAFDGKQQICYHCHKDTDCRKCHQSFDSHGPDWKTRHALISRSADLNCKSCHSRTSVAIYCDLCHTPAEVTRGQSAAPATAVPPADGKG